MSKMDWQKLSLREKIGQIVVLQTIPEDHIALCGSIEAFLKKYPVGGLFCAGKLINAKMFEIEDFGQQMEEYIKYSKIPLLFNADMENGTETNGMKLLPPAIALSATNNPDIAYDYGRALAKEAKAAGVNLLNSPVVDMSLYPMGGTDTRGAGDDRDRVVMITSKIAEGMMSEGVMPVIKHFPCGGHARMDSHMVSVNIDSTIDEWEETNGYVYRKMFEKNIPALMTTHDSFPPLQSEAEIDEKGDYLIASLSKELVSGLLKEKLGFKGCILSDALCMGGFAGNDAVENVIKCFEAGHDLLLWPPVQVIDEIEKRILDGRIPMERLDDAVSRIWALKDRLGLFREDNKQETEPYDKEFLDQVSKKVSENCITLVNNKSGRIPFDKSEIKKVLIIGVTPDDNDYRKLSELVGIFEKRGIEAEIWRDTWIDVLNEEKQAEYDLILFAVSRIFHHPIGSEEVYGNQACSIWAAHNCNPTKTVMAGFGSPYVYKYFSMDDMFINCYWMTYDLLEAFVACLFGEIPFTGTSPVRLNKVFDKVPIQTNIQP